MKDLYDFDCFFLNVRSQPIYWLELCNIIANESNDIHTVRCEIKELISRYEENDYVGRNENKEIGV